MTSPTEDPTLLAKALEYAWAGVLALGGLVWKGQEAKVSALAAEQNRQRDVMAKLFDKLEQNRNDFTEAFSRHAERSEDRHRELLTTIHQGLAGKADK